MSELWKTRSETEAGNIVDEGLAAILRRHPQAQSVKIFVRYFSGELLGVEFKETKMKTEE